MKTLAIATASILAVLAAHTVLASDIYKWTDEDGNVHYGDRPNGDQPERIAIASNRTNSAQIQETAEARAESRAADEAEEAEAADAAAKAAPSEEEMKAYNAERAQQCEVFKARMEKFDMSRRLYRQDDNGERTYLDEAQTVEARQRVEQKVAEYCNP